MNNKDKWYEWEEIVAKYYESKWYKINERNYTIRWWELDIVAENNDNIAFIEVKTVDHIDDLFDYISKKKIASIKKTMEYYLFGHPTKKDIQIDVVFVKNKNIIEIYENLAF